MWGDVNIVHTAPITHIHHTGFVKGDINSSDSDSDDPLSALVSDGLRRAVADGKASGLGSGHAAVAKGEALLSAVTRVAVPFSSYSGLLAGARAGSNPQEDDHAPAEAKVLAATPPSLIAARQAWLEHRATWSAPGTTCMDQAARSSAPSAPSLLEPHSAWGRFHNLDVEYKELGIEDEPPSKRRKPTDATESDSAPMPNAEDALADKYRQYPEAHKQLMELRKLYPADAPGADQPASVPQPVVRKRPINADVVDHELIVAAQEVDPVAVNMEKYHCAMAEPSGAICWRYFGHVDNAVASMTRIIATRINGAVAFYIGVSVNVLRRWQGMPDGASHKHLYRHMHVLAATRGGRVAAIMERRLIHAARGAFLVRNKNRDPGGGGISGQSQDVHFLYVVTRPHA